MPDNIETEIRKALDAKAHDIEVPEGLSERTLAFARKQEPQPLWGRYKSWRDGRESRQRVAGYPRALYAGAAAASAVLLFVVGAVVTRPVGTELTTQASQTVDETSIGRKARGSSETSAAKPMSAGAGTSAGASVAGPPRAASGAASSGDAAGGRVADVVPGSVESVNTAGSNASTDADADSGDGDFSDQASAFTSLNAGADEPMGALLPASGPYLDPKLVRSADIRVAVKDFDPAWDQANDIARKYNGAVINSRTQQIEDRIAQGTVTMRVPSEKLEQVLNDLRSLGTLASLDTSGDDIAAQIDDVKQNVAEVRKEEAELLDMQVRARTVTEQLQVKSRLEDVRKRIASLKKRQQNFEDQVELSSVSATIVEDASVADDSSVLGRALETGVSAALTILAGTLVLLGGLIPLALLALATWFVVRTVRKRRPAA